MDRPRTSTLCQTKTMETSLQDLFTAIAAAKSEIELREPIMTEIGKYFTATRFGLAFLDQLPKIESRTPKMIELALSLDYNPVLRYLIQRHAAVHEEVILPAGMWQKICPREDHGHVMLGPVISHGQLVGGIAFTRHRDDPAFNADNLADLNALCLHISSRLATMRSQPVAFGANINHLTNRESQIAELVAKGLTSSEIGATLWITENSVKQALKRMYRKLNVSSRAEMVAHLSINNSIEISL